MLLYRCKRCIGLLGLLINTRRQLLSQQFTPVGTEISCPLTQLSTDTVLSSSILLQRQFTLAVQKLRFLYQCTLALCWQWPVCDSIAVLNDAIVILLAITLLQLLQRHLLRRRMCPVRVDKVSLQLPVT